MEGFGKRPVSRIQRHLERASFGKSAAIAAANGSAVQQSLLQECDSPLDQLAQHLTFAGFEGNRIPTARASGGRKKFDAAPAGMKAAGRPAIVAADSQREVTRAMTTNVGLALDHGAPRDFPQRPATYAAQPPPIAHGTPSNRRKGDAAATTPRRPPPFAVDSTYDLPVRGRSTKEADAVGAGALGHVTKGAACPGSPSTRLQHREAGVSSREAAGSAKWP